MGFLPATLARARAWGESTLDLIFPWPESCEPEATPIRPPFCRQCGDAFLDLPADQAEFVCTPCSGHRWHFEWARAACRTEGRAHEAITGFKYRDEYYRMTELVKLLDEAFARYAAAESWHGLVPVPLYHRRRRERGFNQAHELARGLGRARKMAVRDILYRERETPSQTGLVRHARFENMSGAFVLKPGFDVTGQNLLLIDDVFTTGATTNACARVLARAGAGRLAVLTVSRS